MVQCNPKTINKKPVALITGSAVRIGHSIATYLGQQGFDLILHYGQSDSEAQQLKKILDEQSVKSYLLQADLSNKEKTDSFFASIPSAFKPVTLLMNSAAVFPEDDEWQHLSSHWDHIMSINAYAPLSLSQQLACEAAENNSQAQIINIIDARLTKPDSDHFVYRLAKSVLKEATLNFSKALAPDIRVNALALGAILAPPGAPQDHLKRLSKRIPLQKTGDLKQVNQAIQYLLEQDFVTGEVLTLDGGEFL